MRTLLLALVSLGCSLNVFAAKPAPPPEGDVPPPLPMEGGKRLDPAPKPPRPAHKRPPVKPPTPEPTAPDPVR